MDRMAKDQRIYKVIMLDKGATEAAVSIAWDKGFYAAALFIIR